MSEAIEQTQSVDRTCRTLCRAIEAGWRGQFCSYLTDEVLNSDYASVVETAIEQDCYWAAKELYEATGQIQYSDPLKALPHSQSKSFVRGAIDARVEISDIVAVLLKDDQYEWVEELLQDPVLLDQSEEALFVIVREAMQAESSELMASVFQSIDRPERALKEATKPDHYHPTHERSYQRIRAAVEGLAEQEGLSRGLKGDLAENIARIGMRIIERDRAEQKLKGAAGLLSDLHEQYDLLHGHYERVYAALLDEYAENQAIPQDLSQTPVPRVAPPQNAESRAADFQPFFEKLVSKQPPPKPFFQALDSQAQSVLKQYLNKRETTFLQS